MKRLLSVMLTLVLLLGLCTVTLPARAASVSALPTVSLSYFDEEVWTVKTGDALQTPAGIAAYGGTSATAKADTRALGVFGKPADDASFKVAPLETYSLPDKNADIAVNYINTGAKDRYALTTAQSDTILVSMDFATSVKTPSGQKNVLGGKVGAAVADGATNWPAMVQLNSAGTGNGGNVVAYEPETWYNLAYEISSNGTNATYKTYIDGVLTASGNIHASYNFLEVLRTNIQISANTPKVDDLYLDNLAIYTGESFSDARYHSNKDAAALNFLHFKGSNTAKNDITDDLDLAATFEGADEGTVITWASSDSDIINPATGVVTQSAVNTPVTLTATITNGTKVNTKTFDLTVSERAANPQEIIDAKNVLQALYDANYEKVSGNYSEESFTTFSSALSAASAAIAGGSITLTELTEATEALKSAVNGLIRFYPTTYGTIVHDANTQQGNAGTTFNSDTLAVKYRENYSNSTSRNTYIGADIENISTDSNRVHLKLYAKAIVNPQSQPFNLYTTSAFNETTLTYTNRPSTGTFITSATNEFTKTGAGWVVFDITDYILEQKAIPDRADSMVWFVIDSPDTDNISVGFWSKEYTADASLRPTLVGFYDNTIAQEKQDDLAAIDMLDYINDASLDSITQSLSALPAAGGLYGYPITWASSNTSVISDAGALTLPSETTQVTMTASITADGVTFTRDFELTVRVYTEFELDCASLTFDSIKNNNKSASAVDSALNLVAAGASGNTAITWESSDEDVINSLTGAVVRTANEIKRVVLTANLSNGLDNDTKDIVVYVYGDSVLKDDADDKGKLVDSSAGVNPITQYAYTAFRIDSNGLANQYLTYKVVPGAAVKIRTLINTGNAGSTDFILSVAGSDGVFTAFDTTVTKTQISSDQVYSGSLGRYDFVLDTAIPEGMEYLKIGMPASNRAWAFNVDFVEITHPDWADDISFEDIKGLNGFINQIGSDLELPAASNDGGSIVWTSGNTAVVGNDGSIAERPAAAAAVTLTAAVTREDSVQTLIKYPLTVQPYTSDITAIEPWAIKDAQILSTGLTCLKGNVLTAYAKVTNMTGEDKTVTLVTAVYQAGTQKLLDIKVTEVVVDGDVSAPQVLEGAALTLSNETAGIYAKCTVKVFVWDAFADMQPKSGAMVSNQNS